MLNTEPVIKTNAQGLRLLHIWRIGQTYKIQKESFYRRDWTSLYFSRLPQPPHVKDIFYYDIRGKLPFQDHTFDGVYAFHIIEHLTPREAEQFVREILRLLKPQGIFRISTPDLEDAVRNYLRQLEACWLNPTQNHVLRYRWSQLELLDQIVRDKSGGAMEEAVHQGYFEPAYAQERYGDVFKEFSGKLKTPAYVPPPTLPWSKRLKKISIETIARKVNGFVSALCYRMQLKRVLKELNNDPHKTFEVNKWEYDRLSLRRLLEQAGFENTLQKTYKTSDLPGWERYQLDQSTLGDHAIEPSLYMEARKPRG